MCDIDRCIDRQIMCCVLRMASDARVSGLLDSARNPYPWQHLFEAEPEVPAQETPVCLV